MGTTLTALRFRGGQVGLVHVGDSRAYLLRNGVLSQITHDDTYVQYLVDSGKLTPEEAKDHPRRSVILRALLGTEVDPDVSIREARAGDRYMLCSDGLTDVVSAETIAETMQIPDTQECADRLVELALRGGGPDNVTVIVADVINARVGDVVDDVPVVAGAFIDPAAEAAPGDGSPAERARQLTRGAPAEEPIQHRVKRKRWRGLLWGLLLLVILIGALAGAYAWTQTQYFVGRAGNEVAIFRGVNTEFGPLKFYGVYENSDLKFSDLKSFERDKVSAGLTAGSLKDARRIVSDIRSHGLLPACSTPTPTPTPTPSTPSTSPSTSKTPSTHVTTSRRHGTTTTVKKPTTHATTTHATTTTPPAPVSVPTALSSTSPQPCRSTR
jgi:protein phosphatase